MKVIGVACDILILLFLPLGVLADSWYAGLGVGHSISNETGKASIDDGGQLESVNKDFDSNDITSGSITFGRHVKGESVNVLFEATASLNNQKTTVSNQGNLGDIQVVMERPLVFGMNVGFEKPLGDNVSAVVKLGFTAAKFDTTLRDTAAGQKYSGKNSQYKLGLAPSIGFQKHAGNYTIGLAYTYQMYQKLKAQSIDIQTRTTFTNEIDPRYHLVELYVTKKF